jgi:hypothetical protein
MSQTPVDARATPTDVSSQLGGQVQPVEAEGTMSGFTAVNGSGSPTSQPVKSATIVDLRDESSLPPREPSQRSTAEGEQVPQRINGSGHHISASPTNGTHKRKRSVIDIEDDRSSDGSPHSTSSPYVSPDVQMQEASTSSRPATETGEVSWNGQHNDDQAEQLRMLAPIQRENQQHTNGTFPAQHIQNDHGMRPGYHKDEATGMIITNAGVQMDPKKRKRVSWLLLRRRPL